MVLSIFYFVGATTADALSIGFRTILIDDCCRGVELVDIEKTKNSVIANHGVIVTSSQVRAIIHFNNFSENELIMVGKLS